MSPLTLLLFCSKALDRTVFSFPWLCLKQRQKKQEEGRVSVQLNNEQKEKADMVFPNESITKSLVYLIAKDMMPFLNSKEATV